MYKKANNYDGLLVFCTYKYHDSWAQVAHASYFMWINDSYMVINLYD